MSLSSSSLSNGSNACIKAYSIEANTIITNKLRTTTINGNEPGYYLSYPMYFSSGDTLMSASRFIGNARNGVDVLACDIICTRSGIIKKILMDTRFAPGTAGSNKEYRFKLYENGIDTGHYVSLFETASVTIVIDLNIPVTVGNRYSFYVQYVNSPSTSANPFNVTAIVYY